MLFDTHAHLTDERFKPDLPAVLERAAAAGVEHVICVATTAADSPQCVEVASRFGPVFASVGIQPNNVAQAGPADWDAIVQLADGAKVVAIGETGLDRYWDDAPFPLQEDYFARHLALARARDLPVIIHCREAEYDVVRMLRDEFDRHGPIRGVLHSFTGGWPAAEACLAMGLYVSFAGMVTFKNANDLRGVAGQVPADRLLVETDCPYLAPVPVRGQRNEPAHIAHTAACLAKLRGIDAAQFAAETAANARRMFASIPS